MGAVQCCGFGMCVDGVPCYGKDDALIDNDGNLGETNNKNPSKWCVDDSATERVFIPDGEPHACMPPGLLSTAGLKEVAYLERETYREGERETWREKKCEKREVASTRPNPKPNQWLPYVAIGSPS